MASGSGLAIFTEDNENLDLNHVFAKALTDRSVFRQQE